MVSLFRPETCFVQFAVLMSFIELPAILLFDLLKNRLIGLELIANSLFVEAERLVKFLRAGGAFLILPTCLSFEIFNTRIQLD